MANCDVCGKTVEKKDDVAVLGIFAGGDWYYVLALPLHIRCDPSRAQYIVHPGFEPVVDDRPEYDKRLLPADEVADREQRWTAAWEKLQEDSDA